MSTQTSRSSVTGAIQERAFTVATAVVALGLAGLSLYFSRSGLKQVAAITMVLALFVASLAVVGFVFKLWLRA